MSKKSCEIPQHSTSTKACMVRHRYFIYMIPGKSLVMDIERESKTIRHRQKKIYNSGRKSSLRLESDMNIKRRLYSWSVVFHTGIIRFQYSILYVEAIRSVSSAEKKRGCQGMEGKTRSIRYIDSFNSSIYR